MKKLVYFAYGSNLCSQRLKYRIGKFQKVENYILKDYKLVFNCGGFANIQPSPGDEVEGVLYTIDPDQLSVLNHYEGLYNTQFFDYNKDTIAVVYIGTDRAVEQSEYFNERPKLEYLQIIQYGCEEHGLHKLHKQIQNLINTLPVKKKVKLRRK